MPELLFEKGETTLLPAASGEVSASVFIMTKDNFNKMVAIDGWTYKEGPSDIPSSKFTYQSSYFPPYDKYKKYIILAVYTYPTKYVVKVYYKNGDVIDLPCKTENEAYGLLYRFIYAPDTINFTENGEKVTEEEFAKNESKRRWSLKNLFRRT